MTTEPLDLRTHKIGAARLSIVPNSLLTLLKLTVGVVSGSVSILSEAIHSASDLVASWIARAQPEKLNLGMAVMGLSVVVNVLIARFLFRVARRTDSLRWRQTPNICAPMSTPRWGCWRGWR